MKIKSKESIRLLSKLKDIPRNNSKKCRIKFLSIRGQLWSKQNKKYSKRRVSLKLAILFRKVLKKKSVKQALTKNIANLKKI